MSNNVPIPRGLLRVDSKLTHDIYDKSGKLLLRRGTVLESESLVERLEKMGYFDPEAVDAIKAAAAVQKRVIPTGYTPDRSGTMFSVFAELTTACERLQNLFTDHQVPLEKEILAVSASIEQCCAIDSDASLAAALNPLPFPHNVRHPVNVAVLVSVILTRQKHDKSRQQATIAAALTMNIGALELHDNLFSWTETLTDEQRAEVRAHPGASVKALLGRDVRNPLWLAIISQHHEAIDGTGYPSGLKGDKILPESQVVSLADRYCSMVTERAHRDPLLPPLAIKELHARHGSAISPTLIGALVGAMGIYPPGTCVRLANGETAVVVHRLVDPKHPVAYAISGPSGGAYDPVRKRLTASQPGYAIEKPVQRKDVKVDFVPEQLWPPTLAATKPLPTG